MEEINCKTEKNQRITKEYENTPITWRRLVARIIDFKLGLMCTPFLLMSIIRVPFSFTDSYQTEGAFGVLKYFAYYFLSVTVIFLIDAFITKAFGTTIGKRIMNIWVHDKEGENLDFDKALLRNFGIMKYGIGFFIPSLNMILIYKRYRKLSKNRYENSKSKWDYVSGAVIEHCALKSWNYILAILIIF